MPLFFYPHFFFLNQHKHLKYWRISIHCLVVLHVWSVFFTHKVLVRNFAADYNLGSIKMKPNIFLKNEHSCVQQEIALAHCQPIPDRKKDVIQKENCTTKCCYVHLPENSADTSHHLIFTMHPLSFKAVFFCNFIPHYSKEKGSFNPVSFERKLTLCSWCNNEDMVDIGLNTSLNWRSLRKQWL